MITSKEEYSVLCQQIHHYIINHDFNIKLSSVREAVAQAFQHKSVSALLANLPIELTPGCCFDLSNILQNKHRINIIFTLFSLPFPKGTRLSAHEQQLIWKQICSFTLFEMDENMPFQFSLLTNGLTKNVIMGSMPPKGMTPSGDGDWYCDEHNEVSKQIKSFSLNPTSHEIQQNKLIAENKELAKQICKDLAPVFFKYWNDEEKWLITSASAVMCKERMFNAKGKPVDLSSELTTPFSVLIEIFKDYQSPALNRFSNIINASLESNDTVGSYLSETLVQGAIGHCIFNEINKSEFDYNALLWNALNAIKPYTANHSNDREKHEFYNDFLWSINFKNEIREIAVFWLKEHPDWNMPLGSLALQEFKAPAILDDSSFRIQESEFANHFSNNNLHVYELPFCRGEESFGYHDEIEYEEDVKTIDDFLDVDETALMKEIQQWAKDGEIKPNMVQKVYKEVLAERKDEAEDAYHGYVASLPFVEPFRLERLTIESVNENNETLFLADGTYFSEIDSADQIGTHLELLDSMTQYLCDVSCYVKKHMKLFNGCYENVFYITELVICAGATPKSIAKAIYDGLELSKDEPNEHIIILHSDALTHAYFLGAPYNGYSLLSERYKTFVIALMNELKGIFTQAHYIR